MRFVSAFAKSRITRSGKGRLAVQDGRRAHLILADLDVVPNGRQVADVGLEVGVARAFARGADDEAEVRRFHALHDVAQASALAIGVDLARDPDLLRPRA